MTLSTFLAPQPPQYGHQPPQYGYQPPDMDRTDWSSDGWKGGKGNPKSALSALTLLAFLFFLNILQNCLKDTMGQTPTVMVTMVNLTRRIKRENNQNEPFVRESLTPACTEWTNREISNLVHNHVQLHWNSESGVTINNFKNRYKLNSLKNDSYLIQTLSKVITETLNAKSLSEFKANNKIVFQDAIINTSLFNQRSELKTSKEDIFDFKKSQKDSITDN